MKNKTKKCPKCGLKMKFRGNKTFYCKNCHRSYHFSHDVEFEKDKDGNIKQDMFGKPKIQGRKASVKSWTSNR